MAEALYGLLIFTSSTAATVKQPLPDSKQGDPASSAGKPQGSKGK